MSIEYPPVSSPAMTASKQSTRPPTARRVGRALSFRTPASKPRKQRKSRVLYHFSKQELEPYFHISQKEAAKCLGIAVITLKRICKRGNFNWPYRANKAKGVDQRPKRRPAATNSMVREGSSRSSYSYACRRDTPARSESAPCETNTGDSFEEQMRKALQSLATCTFKLDDEPEDTAPATMSAAARAFSLLPHMCMTENTE